MNECELNIRIKTNDKLSVNGQIELVEVLRTRLKEILDIDALIFVSRGVNNEEIMEALR